MADGASGFAARSAASRSATVAARSGFEAPRFDPPLVSPDASDADGLPWNHSGPLGGWPRRAEPTSCPPTTTG